MLCLPARRRLVPTALLAAMVVAFDATPHAAVVLDTVVIRVYENPGIPADVRATMLRTAAEVLRGGDLSVEWLVCPARRLAGVPRGCSRAPLPYDFVVRLTTSPRQAPAQPRPALGFSLLDPMSGNGLSTVYVDRVDWLARQAQVSRGLVLGRALAHEISHLLLGSNGHTERGLLREYWTAEELVRNRLEDWQLSPAQRADVRIRLTRAGVLRAATRTGKTGAGG